MSGRGVKAQPGDVVDSRVLEPIGEAGLIEGSRRGRWIDYHLAADAAALVATALDVAGFGAAVDQPAGCAESCVVPVP